MIFLLAWDAFMADQGETITCHSGRGTQLVAAAKQNPDMGPFFQLNEEYCVALHTRSSPVQEWCSGDLYEEDREDKFNKKMMLLFTRLLPTHRLQHERRDIRLRDVVLAQYDGKSSPGSYRLACG